jgi:hypothetical protein
MLQKLLPRPSPWGSTPLRTTGLRFNAGLAPVQTNFGKGPYTSFVKRDGSRKDRQKLGDCFRVRSIGYIQDIVLGERRTRMYWYNPTTHTSERVAAPSGDMQAIQMLAGTPDSAEFVEEYCKLRRSGTPVEQALVLVGHKVRLRQPEYQLVLR